jgi:hypothetical protein
VFLIRKTTIPEKPVVPKMIFPLIHIPLQRFHDHIAQTASILNPNELPEDTKRPAGLQKSQQPGKPGSGPGEVLSGPAQVLERFVSGPDAKVALNSMVI